MSDFKINSIATKQGQHGPVIAGVSTVNSTGCMKIPSGPTEFRGGRGRGIFAGGQPGNTNTIEHVTIATEGNGTDFGDLTVGRQTGLGGASSSTRGVFMSGFDPSSAINVIDFVTISSIGNAFDFGDLRNVSFNAMRLSNNIRGLHAGVSDNTNYRSDIDVVTIATKGNANKFGDLSAPAQGGGATSSSTRGVIALGRSPAGANDTNILEFVTIMSDGNSQDFGDLSVVVYSSAATSNGIRGVFSGNNNGAAQADIIDFITIASKGDARDFGNLSRATSASGSNNSMAATSNSIRGLFAGGYLNAPTIVNNIDFITIATIANSTDFGDLLTARRTFDGCSDSHGGIGE